MFWPAEFWKNRDRETENRAVHCATTIRVLNIKSFFLYLILCKNSVLVQAPVLRETKFSSYKEDVGEYLSNEYTAKHGGRPVPGDG